jgi:type I restriction enzyme S subunit
LPLEHQDVALNTGWEAKTLGDLFDITSSKRVFESDWQRDGVPFYRAREIVKLARQGFVNNELFISEDMFSRYAAKYGIPSTGDLMVTGVGTLGICYVVKEHDRFYFKDGNIIWLKKKADVESRFVEYAFQSDLLRKQIDDSVGTTVGTYTIIKAKNTVIPVPPPAEQQRIVAALDEAFAAIATARANTEQNLRNANDLFRSHLNSIFTGRREGWLGSKLGLITTKIGSGATPRGGEASYKSEGISLIRSLNVHDLGFRKNGLAFLDSAQADGLSNVEVKPRDVLLNITGASVARCCVVPDVVLPARVNQHVSIIRPVAGTLDASFLHYMLISERSKSELLRTGADGGSTRQAIIKADIQSFTVWYPATLKEQEAFVAELDAVLAETQRLVSTYQRKLVALDGLKQSLLHQAFTGAL